MEEKLVILSKLKIKRLYGKYDYDVNFNADITLIYGTNGCGKTTILNIITSIITGSIYKLFSYKFDRITLSYYDENDKRTKKRIVLSYKSEIDGIVLEFHEYKAAIKKIQNPEERRRRKDSYDELYFEEYPVLIEVRREFNYIYLALNRANMLPHFDDFYYIGMRPFYSDEEILEPESVDPEIRYVENLIGRRYVNATTQINAINNGFRNAILKSALDVNSQTDLESFLKNADFGKLSEKDITKTKDSYMKILSELQVASDEEKKQYANFFEKYSNRLNGNEKTIELKEMFELFTAFNEMKKIKKIVEIAADAEKQKADIMKPIELFLQTVNEFISTSDSKKRVEINDDGRVYFRTEDNEKGISIQYLSSGEKQLLVFFANLVFGVKDTSSGIFVVDEPELSLHLSWQRVFVKKALEVNKNVQFIFATHAPEIMADYRNKSEKLQRIESR
jgi:predicted ATP-binding protein involved in virulence